MRRFSFSAPPPSPPPPLLLSNLFTMQMGKKLGEGETESRRAKLGALQSIICLSVLGVPSEVKLCQVYIKTPLS